MALTEEQLEHFYREGYVVVPGLVPRDAVDKVLDAAPKEATDGGRWTARVFDHFDTAKDAVLHQLLVQPGIVEAASQIFGNAPRIWYGMLAVVPARGGNGLPWHQDNQYTRILGGALNTFVALSPITPENAGLWVAPRSHWHGTQLSKTNASTAPGHREAVVEPEGGIPLPAMSPGDVCIFDRNTYHRSLTNATDRHRFAYAAQYLAENARMAETGKRDDARVGPAMRATELANLWKGSLK